MRQLLKTLFTSLAFIGLLTNYSSIFQPVFAQVAEPPTAQQQQTPVIIYSFTTPPGCSLSLLVRRALQLYDQNKTNISLTPAQAMYAETNIVNRMGGRLLDVGEKVSIDGALLDEYVQSSQSLTADQATAWQYYANQADFDISSITPESGDPAVSSPATQSSDTITNESQQKPVSTSRAPKSSSPAWYLWLIAAAALGGMYLLMDTPRKK